jgi:hypothetical protein
MRTKKEIKGLMGQILYDYYVDENDCWHGIQIYFKYD